MLKTVRALLTRNRGDQGGAVVTASPFDERWLSLLIVFGMLGLLLRAPALVAISVIVLVISAISRALAVHAANRSDYERRFDQRRLFAGETLRVSCRASNLSRLPLVSLYVRDDAPRGFLRASDTPGGAPIQPDPTGRINLAQQLSLAERSVNTRSTTLVPTRRGHFRFETPSLEASDLLGLTDAERRVDRRDAVLVYPRTVSLDSINLPARQPIGALATRRRLIEDTGRTMGARDYAPGDSQRLIHWKATARAGKLQTRVHEYTSEPVAMVLLNVTTFNEVWFGSDPLRFEWAISVAASIASWAQDGNGIIGFSSNGCTPGSPEAIRVPAKRSPNQLADVLETLAMLGPFTMSRFAEYLLLEQRRLPANATQLIVTPMWDEAIELAVHRLVALGKRISVICTDYAFDVQRPLPCPASHLPPTDDFADWQRRFAAGENNA